MKKFIFTFIAMLSILVFTLPIRVSAVEFPNPQTITTDNHTVQEEAEGKEIWEKLQAKQLECKNLTNDYFEVLGEYFMGQMMGTSHEAMNNMMENMMGKEGEEQMHVVMGKRLSGCDTSASGVGIIPMMSMIQMMGSAFAPESFGGTKGGGNPMLAPSAVEGMGYGGWNNMMGGFGIFGWLSMIIFWLLLILAVIALVKWLTTSRKTDSSKTPLEILKERYAKGEIDRKEFKEMKKELS